MITDRIRHFAGLGIIAMIGFGLSGCAPESSGTFGPYDPSAWGRTDCSFSTRLENGGVCPRIPIPTISVPGIAAPEPPGPDKGCSLVDYATGMMTCPAPQVAPGEESFDPPPGKRYCYRTLGGIECYDKPANDPNRKPVTVAPATPGLGAPR